MTEVTTEVAVIDLKNTTEGPLTVSLAVGGVERHIITLQPGESTRQATPSGVSWVFSPGTEPTGGGGERMQEQAPLDLSEANARGPQAGIDRVATSGNL